MSERRSFYRKVGYAIAIAALLFPLAWLSMPATSREAGGNLAGGKLAQLRDKYQLGQANLGEIDPASETMKLATLGLRGVAVNLLWEKANYYKKVEDWDNLSATLNQLANLQPNVVTFWKFQAWNLSYNVSVEFDDFRDRYAKVIEGINFLKRGERYNEGNAQLLWDLGWFIGQKIGRADEHVQFRRLFKEDPDFHPADRPQELRDNWLVGKSWYERAVDWVNRFPTRLGRKSPRIFFEGPAKSQINYAEAIEEEGYFDKARRAWLAAGEEWGQFGQLPIEHSSGVVLKLGDKARLEKEVADLRTKLDAMLPGVREQLKEEKRAAVPSEDLALLDMPEHELTPEQLNKLYEVQAKIDVTDRDVAARIASDQPEVAKQALSLVNELDRQGQLLMYTNNYRRDSNFDFWENKCNFEPTPNALAARELMYRARKAYLSADLPTAKRLYDEGFAKWRLVVDEFPLILDIDSTDGDDLFEYVKQYREVLVQLEETIGDDFPLWEIIEGFDREQEFAEELMTYKKRHPDKASESAGDEEAADEVKEQPAQDAPEASSDDTAPTTPAGSEANPPQ